MIPHLIWAVKDFLWVGKEFGHYDYIATCWSRPGKFITTDLSNGKKCFVLLKFLNAL